MSLAIDTVSGCLLLGGVAVGLLGGAGVLRFPDFYSRMHAAGMTDTLCTVLVLLGLMLQSGLSEPSLKLALIGLFYFVTSPTAAHALVKAAYAHGLAAEVDAAPTSAGVGRPEAL
ncbi:MAG: monovalent cation/H(+) antiporter subunit G [Proteobacteria bacterium]|nr:monovalent cation/H(+) antiporter subunit G [Pseudomonadota bacterium]